MSDVLDTGFEALLGDFVLDVAERLDQLERWLLDLDSADSETHAQRLADIRRELHTLKGNAGMMGLAGLQDLAHRMEEITESRAASLRAADLLSDVDRFRKLAESLVAPAASSESGHDDRDSLPGQVAGSVRVSFAVLDPLMDQLAETVVLQNRLSDAIAAGAMLDGSADDFTTRARALWYEAGLCHDALARRLDALRDGVMGLRLTPLQTLFGSVRRIVHDEAAREGKSVELVTSGGDVPLDKALLGVATDALGHLVRNGVIHGMETPATRIAAGKPRTGTISVSAQVRGDEVRIEVSDDGAGIDPDRLREVAATRGVAVPADVLSILFEPGFTTRAGVDMSSGRGVGLAAVRDAVRQQGGEIVILSEQGRGTTFRMDLPMSVSIARTMLVRADNELYALPLSAVLASRRLEAGDGHRVNGAGVMNWRNDVITLLDLGCHFGTGKLPRQRGYVVIVQAGGKRRGLVADAIHGLQEVVVKGLDPIVGKPRGVAGSTVLGDGRPILILDPRSLVEAQPFTPGVS